MIIYMWRSTIISVIQGEAKLKYRKVKLRNKIISQITFILIVRKVRSFWRPSYMGGIMLGNPKANHKDKLFSIHLLVQSILDSWISRTEIHLRHKYNN